MDYVDAEPYLHFDLESSVLISPWEFFHENTCNK